jgi:hypothetical protein
MFIKFYHREFFGEIFKNDYRLDGFLEVPLTVEEPSISVPNSISSKILEILKSTSKGSKPMNESLVEEFMQLAKDYEEEFLK